jgi:HSP20 family protein
MFGLKRHESRENPFTNLERRFKDIYEDFLGDNFMSLASVDFSPKVDIKEDEKSIRVIADLPGMDEKDIDVSLKENVLTIGGERKEEKKSENDKEYRIERSIGSFSRSFSLPENTDTGNIKASYKKGVLKIEIPKTEKSGTKKLKINVE